MFFQKKKKKKTVETLEKRLDRKKWVEYWRKQATCFERLKNQLLQVKLLLFVKVNSPDRRYIERGYWWRYFRFREGNLLVATFSHNNPSSATWSVYVKRVNQRTNDVTAISTKIKEQLRDPCPQRDRESENEEQAVIAAVNPTTERPLPYICSFRVF